MDKQNSIIKKGDRVEVFYSNGKMKQYDVLAVPREGDELFYLYDKVFEETVALNTRSTAFLEMKVHKKAKATEYCPFCSKKID